MAQPRRRRTKRYRHNGDYRGIAVLLAVAVVIVGGVWGVSALMDRADRPAASSATPQVVTAQSASPAPSPSTEPTAQPTQQAPAGNTVRIRAAGDIIVYSSQIKYAEVDDGSYDFTRYFADIAPYLSDADLTLANLEVPVYAGDTYAGYPSFNSPPELLTALKGAGIDVLTTANNHANDRGFAGMKATLSALDEAGFAHTGTCKTRQEAQDILFLEKNGVKIAILAYTDFTNDSKGALEGDERYCVNYFELGKAKSDIAKAREQGAQAVILCLHWGVEYDQEPSQKQEQQAQELIASGADVIFGSHPHVLQKAERVTATDADGNSREGVVIYSMGNFFADQRKTPRDSGVIMEVTLTLPEGADRVQVGQSGCIPTFIYRYNNDLEQEDPQPRVPEDGSSPYRLLPVEPFLSEENLRQLDAIGQARIQQVWQEAQSCFAGAVPVMSSASPSL